MNEPRVRRHMPLAVDGFDQAAFAGWGGLQPEAGDADLGLVLHPRFCGAGPVIYQEILRRGFDEMGLASLTILPPHSRRARAPIRLGFEPDGEAELGGVRFQRFRLRAPVR